MVKSVVGAPLREIHRERKKALLSPWFSNLYSHLWKLGISTLHTSQVVAARAKAGFCLEATSRSRR